PASVLGRRGEGCERRAARRARPGGGRRCTSGLGTNTGPRGGVCAKRTPTERSEERLRPQASAGGKSPKATASAQRGGEAKGAPPSKVKSACGRKRAPEGSRHRRPRARSEVGKLKGPHRAK